jgi:hypothetical protein
MSKPVKSEAENMWIDGWNSYIDGVVWGGEHPLGFTLGWLDAARFTVLSAGLDEALFNVLSTRLGDKPPDPHKPS